ncbi:MAG: TetR family transcriptional regulator [Cobetia sp.]|jgi:AcrR family transcriptional regulator|uniref:TetR/AcrR family transcriptional regulator n=1 Tax=Cobetia TaxID=204286 RepID=UPI000C4D68F8|nr:MULTISPECIES: TetR/AcrR family transcriptional regulator [Cobetia]MBK09693.1 TetR family transcriptional regulator [Cobetia sp.]MDH2296834.1 helix-turn-helix domain containing protein [Cobetia sp. 29-18-1]UBU48087.1 TetR/AcrR family transcriptional regulator [Cobetia amphilecti]HAR07792.1 TetR family transcriptional regulator [Cobetia sp.]HBJ29317.1 TetR family transcriptional regulator [Cobetia sp.]|tara:strand:+ start:9309 stop:9935 length:627 start_codon:yes stop_codon:yes gene_type:complete
MRHRDEHKQQALLEATLHEVAEHGFAVTSVARIARAAGMSPGTLYLYYRGKDDLLEATFREVSRRIIAVAIEAFQAEPAEAFEAEPSTLSPAAQQLKSALCRVWNALVALGRRQPALFLFHDQFLHSSHMQDALRVANQERAAPLLDAFALGQQSGILKQIDLALIEVFMFRSIYSLLQGSSCQLPAISHASFDQAFEMAWDAIALRQ